MPKALISTLGFDEKFCYRAVLRHGIREGDKIILVTAKLVEKVLKAFDQVRSFVTTSYGDKVSIKVVELDPNDIVSSVKRMINEIKMLDDYEIIVNLSGGMRVLIFIVLLALMLSRVKISKMEMELEDFSGVVELSPALLEIPRMIAELSEEKLEILKLIREGIDDVNSLALRLKKDESTIRRHLSDLEDLSLIIVERRKPMKVKLSPVAELMTSEQIGDIYFSCLALATLY